MSLESIDQKEMITETDPEKMYRAMQAKLANVVPDFELKMKSEIAAEINRLKVEKNAVILGHNYMEPALFNSVPDFVGDSLELARGPLQTDKDIIVFCGVRFMAETAKILNPTKTVLLPARGSRLFPGGQYYRRGCARVKETISRRAGSYLR